MNLTISLQKMSLKIPANQRYSIALVSVSLLLSAACGTTTSSVSNDRGVQRSTQTLTASRTSPVELKRDILPDDQLVKVQDVSQTQVETRWLSTRQRQVPQRSPNETMAELMRLRSTLDQNKDLCQGLNTSQESFNVKRVTKPPYREFYRDPAFRTRIVRISDAANGQVVKPTYSTIQAWNADESLIILYHTGNQAQGHYLYDGRNYNLIRRLPIEPIDIEQVYWSHTEPDFFYYVSAGSPHFNKLVKFNARSGKASPIVDMAPMCGGSTVPTGGNDVQMPSLDDNMFTFRCSRGNESEMYMHTVNVFTGELRSAKLGSGSDWGNWNAPSISASGQRLRLEDAVLSTDLETVSNYLNLGYDHEHSSMGQTKSGADAMYAVSFDPAERNCIDDVDKGVGHLIEHNLETGECRSLISQGKGYPYTASGTHVSALAHLRPGWVAVSSVADPDRLSMLTDKDTVEPLFSEIYLVNTDPDSPNVCRVAQHRSYGKNSTNGGYQPYFGEPHVSISPTGTRLIFGSDWYDSGAVDTYIVELPAYQP